MELLASLGRDILLVMGVQLIAIGVVEKVVSATILGTLLLCFFAAIVG